MKCNFKSHCQCSFSVQPEAALYGENITRIVIVIIQFVLQSNDAEDSCTN